MTILVNWPAAAMLSAGLAVLLGLTWLLRGGRAVVRLCGAVGITVTAIGLLTRNVITVTGGVIILAVVCWCFWYLREPRRRKSVRA
jgi:hypothetical protein